MQFFTPVTLPYIGAPVAMPVGVCKDGQCAIFTLDWNSYFAKSGNQATVGAIFSLEGNSTLAAQVDKIRTVTIDNTGNPLSVYVLFDDQLEPLVAAPFTVTRLNPQTNARSGLIMCAGLSAGTLLGLPSTRITMGSYFLPPVVAPELQITFPQELGSPAIQNNSSLILTPGYGPRALGDRTYRVPAWNVITPAFSQNVLNTPLSDGFIYITGIVFRIFRLVAAATLQGAVVLESTGTAGTLFEWDYAVTASNAVIEIENINGLNLKIDATQTWRVRNVTVPTGGSPEGIGTMRIFYSNNPK